MNTTHKTARIAGLLYLIVVLSGMFSIAYVPSKVIVGENPAAILHNIQSSEYLFRLGIFGGLICYISFLLLPLVLFKLLQSVHKTYAILMVALAVVSVPLSLINLQHKFAVLTLIGSEPYLNAFTPDQLQAQVLFQLDQYNNGILAVQIFWGLWLFPLGYLIYKSGFLPKILGIILMLGCLGYLVNFVGHFLIPGYAESGLSAWVKIPAAVGEIGTCLWLLIVGVREKRT